MACDLFRQLVNDALEAEGWTIVYESLVLKAHDVRLEIDIATKRITQWIVR